MSYKLTCPSCDEHSSRMFRAYEDGRPCPNCGASLHPASSQFYRQLPEDHTWGHERRSRFIAESSAEFGDADPNDVAKLLDEARHVKVEAMNEDVERETDQHGVEFGENCLTPRVCHQGDRCLGTCKLF